MLTRSGMFLAAAASVVVLAAACSSQANGSPTPESSDSAGSVGSGTPQTKPSNTGIVVPHPLDVSKFLKHSCDVLTDEQVTKGGGDPASGKPDDSLNGAGYSSICRWKAADGSDASFGIGFIVSQEHGLSDTKKFHQRSRDLKVFKLVYIVGFPAYITRSKSDIDTNTCAVQTGVNDHIILLSTVYDSSKSGPCSGAQRLAEAAVSTLKGGA